MWAPKFRTPGMLRSSRFAFVVLRTISGREVPGRVTKCIRKSLSLNEGSKDWPSNGHNENPATATVAAAK